MDSAGAVCLELAGLALDAVRIHVSTDLAAHDADGLTVSHILLLLETTTFRLQSVTSAAGVECAREVISYFRSGNVDEVNAVRLVESGIRDIFTLRESCMLIRSEGLDRMKLEVWKSEAGLEGEKVEIGTVSRTAVGGETDELCSAGSMSAACRPLDTVTGCESSSREEV
jgi:hypothetical protein